MSDDALLISTFAESGSQEVFAHLVGRHVHLVYSACLRQLKNPVLADQATGAVFVLLSRDAKKLKGTLSLVPWLFDTARRVCRGVAKLVKADDGAPAGGAIYAGPTDWAKLGPQIDEAIETIPDGAREAVLLKYVANLSVRDVAEAMDMDDRAAGQRISAGVARLRRYFEARNSFLPPDALVAAIQAHMIQGAPASVSYNATLAALSPASVPSPATAIADAAASSLRRERMISLATALCLVLLAGLCVVKISAMVKRAQLAATQASTAPVGGTDGSADPRNPGKEPVIPVLPPLPEKQPAATKPSKPLDPALVTRFITAIRQSDFNAVQQLVDREESLVNAKDPKTGRSAVEIAADLVLWSRQDSTQIAHFLIDNGADASLPTLARAGHRDALSYKLHFNLDLLNAKDAGGLTLLQRAALLPGSSPECEQVVDMLIQFGAKVDIWSACTFGRMEDVAAALAENPKLVNQPCLGATPLNWATRPRRYATDPLAIPKLLIEKGADIRSRDTACDGMTPLHHAAAWGGQVAVAGLLLEKGADVNVLDDFGWTPLDYAIDRGRKEMVDFFESKGGRRTTKDFTDQPSKTARFYAAVQAMDVDLTHRLLDDTPELATARGITGETPMHWAVRHDQLAAVKHLLEKGGDAKALNARNGQTLLHVAAQHTDDAAMAKLLLEKGIDPAAKDRFGKTALEYATQNGHQGVAGVLKGG
jgi:ankyrin repeat protein/DNA-directed RNA polymerase specialized sigma24 family protein